MRNATIIIFISLFSAMPAYAKTHHVRPSGAIRMRVKVTAYCPCRICCGPGACGLTATSHKIVAGDKIVAVDPCVIPLGSTVILDGRSYLALDTGGAIKGRHIDLLMTGPGAHQRARRWGQKWKTVTILK